MTDTELLDWMQEHGAQLWREKGQWHLFLRVDGQLPIQRTDSNIRKIIRSTATLYDQP